MSEYLKQPISLEQIITNMYIADLKTGKVNYGLFEESKVLVFSTSRDREKTFPRSAPRSRVQGVTFSQGWLEELRGGREPKFL